MTMAEMRKDAGMMKRFRLKRIIAKGFGLALGTFAMYVAFVRFFRAFAGQFYAMFLDIAPKFMRRLNRQSTFDEKTKYIGADHTENA